MICLTSLLDFPRGCACRPKGFDRLVLASPLPSELFANLRCPLVPAANCHKSGFKKWPTVLEAEVWSFGSANRPRATSLALKKGQQAQCQMSGLLKGPAGLEPQIWP